MNKELDRLYRSFFLTNLFKILVPMMIPILILGITSYYIIQHYIVADLQKKNTTVLQQSKKSIEFLFQEQDTLSLTIVASALQFTQLQTILNTEYPSKTALKELAYLKNFIDSPAIGKPYIDSIYIYVDNNFNRFLSSSQGGMADVSTYPDIDWITDMKSPENIENVVWTKKRTILKKGLGDKYYEEKVISLFRRVPLVNKEESLIVLNIKESFLVNRLKQLATFEDSQILFINEANEVVASNHSNTREAQALLTQVNLADSQTNTLSTKDGAIVVTNLYADNNNWNFVSLIPESSLYRLSNQLKNLTIAMLIMSCFLGVGYAYYHTRKVSGHLREIASLLDATRTQKPLTTMDRKKKNDIYSYITDGLLKTFIKRDYLQMKLSSKEYKAQAAEFKALQSQLNPHFLFNTLETINWRATALTGGQSSLNEMIGHLSDILRYSLDEQGNLVSLKKEMLYTQSYISIQQIRYRDSFEVVWHIDAQAYQHLILKLIFQPLIENSISHGFRERHSNGKIKIKITVQSNTMCISVTDNGHGMNKQQLHTLRERLAIENISSGHIGLKNTYKRIKIVYGEKGRLHIKSKEGMGTMIVIEIPIG
ncbi:sensor histidine kinase [Bacillus sp. JJ722]|uniref:sensor histidine kinase n=1 Tax=Bacillus sp. JJ722 TaxID=3122973 RepID=UPI003000C1A6